MNPVDEFLATLHGESEIEKGAGFLGDIWRGIKGGVTRAPITQAMSTSGGIGRAFGEQVPLATAGLAVAGIGTAVSKGYGALKERFTKPRDYKAMMEANPSLKKEPAKKVQMLYNSLRSMAPSMSKDPLIAGSFVRNTLEMSPESGPSIAPQTVKTLAESQRNISDAKGPSAMMRGWTAGGGYWAPLPAPEGPSFEVSPRGGVSARGMGEEQAMALARRLGVEPGGPKREPSYTAGPGGLQGRDLTRAQAEGLLRDMNVPPTGKVEPRPILSSEVREKPVRFSGPLQPGQTRGISHWEPESRTKKSYR